jgi:plasmid stabilization system protein ParE
MILRTNLIKVKRGLAQANVGETVPHAEAKPSSGDAMRIVWTFQAILDVQAARTYIAPGSPQHAASMTASLVAAVDRLASCPFSGAVVPELQDVTIRELFVGTSRVVYRLTPRGVQVLTVIDEDVSDVAATS